MRQILARAARALSMGAAIALGILVLTPAPASAACPATFTGPRSVTVRGLVADIVFDPQCLNIYLANDELGIVEVHPVAADGPARIIGTTSHPKSLDLSLDGRTLYIATSTETTIAVKDAATGAHLRYVSVGTGDEYPVAVAAAADGSVVIATASRGSHFGKIYRWRPAYDRVEPIIGTGRSDPETRVRANADRSVISIVHGWDKTAFKFLPATDRVLQARIPSVNVFGIEPVPRVAYNRTDDVGVVSADTAIFLFDRDQGQTGRLYGGEVRDVAIHDRIAFLSIAGDDLRVLDLNMPARNGFLPIGANIGLASGRLALSADGVLIAALTDSGFALARTDTRAPDTVQFVGYSSTSNAPMSLFRFYNPSAYNQGQDTGTVTIRLSDPGTGAQLAEWTSPPIPAKGASQFSIATIENTMPSPLARRDRYLVSIKADFEGTYSHVVWRPNQAITNITTCDRGETETQRIDHVHSSVIDDRYESYVRITNTQSTRANAALRFYHAGTGEDLGMQTVPVPGNAGVTVSMREFERRMNLSPRTNRTYLSHYVVEFSEPFPGHLQHLVDNKNGGVVADMTPTCPLPWSKLTWYR